MPASWKRSLVLLPAALSLFAQTGTPTFQSATNLVEATAVVRDAQGKAVGDLTADDFQLFDTGKRQVISRFAVEKLQRKELMSVRGGNAAPVARPAAGSALPNHFVAFVLDDQNLIPEHFPLATVAAIRHVSDLRPGDRAAVLSTSGRMVLPFTGDRDELRKALSRMGSLGQRTTFNVSALNAEIKCRITYLTADWIGNGDAASLQNCVPPPGRPVPVPAVPIRPGGGLAPGPPGEAHQIFLENQVRAFADSIVQAGDRDVQSYFTALSGLIDTMSRMPGERSIILLSPGMYIAPRFRNLQDRIIADAVRARVVISGVDPRGVYIRNDPDDPATRTDRWGIAETNERVGFMEDVTSGTGGSFIRGDNDIHGAIRRLDSTPEFIYVLGFSPSDLKLDGKYHALKIVLKHARGLTVLARRGYYAADTEPGAASQVQRRVEGVFFSDQELHDVPVKLQIRSSHKPAGIVLTAMAEIDLHKIQFRKEDALNHNDLTMVVGLFDQNGNCVKDIWKSIPLHPGDEALASLRQSGIEVETEFDVTPGGYVVRLLVRDGESQAMGTKSMPVEIRP